MQEQIIVVEINEGRLEGVFCNNKDVSVVVVDWDAHRDETNDYVTTEDGSELPVSCSVIAKSSFAEMAEETKQAAVRAIGIIAWSLPQQVRLESFVKIILILLLAKGLTLKKPSAQGALLLKAFKKCYLDLMRLIGKLRGYDDNWNRFR